MAGSIFEDTACAGDSRRYHGASATPMAWMGGSVAAVYAFDDTWNEDDVDDTNDARGQYGDSRGTVVMTVRRVG